MSKAARARQLELPLAESFRPRRMVGAETALNLRILEKGKRAEREYLKTGDNAANRTAYWCDFRLVERWRAGLGLGWPDDGRSTR